MGELEAEGVIDRAEGLVQDNRVLKVRIDLTWARAHVAAGRGDARATERLLREAEREAVGTDWFETHIGRFFLLEIRAVFCRLP